MPSPFSFTTEGEEAIAAATVETLLQVRGAASSKRRLIEWGLGMDATDSGTALIDLLRQSTTGTGVSTPAIPWDEDDGTVDVTGFNSFSAEPTPGVVLASYECPQNGGQIGWQYPFGTEPILGKVTTSRLALRVLAPSACNAVAYMVFV